jgi:hypothetical protein
MLFRLRLASTKETSYFTSLHFNAEDLKPLHPENCSNSYLYAIVPDFNITFPICEGERLERLSVINSWGK